MKIAALRNSRVARHRTKFKRLVRELTERPLDLLPERSVACLNQFINGFEIFGRPVWRDLLGFEFWLAERLFYPKDTGARWWRVIQLNSKDDYDGYETFCRLYMQYSRRAQIDVQPTAPDHTFDPDRFDFYQHLYAISRKPGMYLGSGERVQLIAAYLAGYFRGKKDAHLALTNDEKEFFRFEAWLRRTYKCAERYPWYRLVEMWPRGINSFQAFFAEYDAYLTDFGKKPRGLEDLFEIVVSQNGCTTIRRRRKLPKEVMRSAQPAVWWRSTANR
jgi:hypothetical protein